MIASAHVVKINRGMVFKMKNGPDNWQSFWDLESPTEAEDQFYQSRRFWNVLRSPKTAGTPPDWRSFWDIATPYEAANVFIQLDGAGAVKAAQECARSAAEDGRHEDRRFWEAVLVILRKAQLEHCVDGLDWPSVETH